jgi:GH35 family endo-1,4-beta-xylanase
MGLLESKVLKRLFKRIIASQGNFDFSGADWLINWAKQNGKQIRGHNLG